MGCNVASAPQKAGADDLGLHRMEGETVLIPFPEPKHGGKGFAERKNYGKKKKEGKKWVRRRMEKEKGNEDERAITPNFTAALTASSFWQSIPHQPFFILVDFPPFFSLVIIQGLNFILVSTMFYFIHFEIRNLILGLVHVSYPELLSLLRPFLLVQIHC